MVRCIDCVKLEKCAKTSEKPQIVEVVPGCEDGKRKPITNGDRIRGMLDKELSFFLDSVQTDGWNAESFDSLEFPEDVEEWLDWLRQEATT